MADDTIVPKPMNMSRYLLAETVRQTAGKHEGRRRELLEAAAWKLRASCHRCRTLMGPVRDGGELIGWVCPHGHESLSYPDGVRAPGGTDG